MHPLSLVVALMAAAPVALAQDGSDLLEYREFSEDTNQGKLTVEGSFETQWFEYNNLDFRAIDESSDQAILDSDDRGGFPFTGASLGLAYEVEPGVRFFFAASHRGLWGDDQIGGTNRFGSMLYITSLYAEFTAKPEAERAVSFEAGRKNYKLGGLAGGREYVLQDTLDLVLIEIPFGAGTLELMPINVISQTDNDGLDFVNYIGTSDLPTYNFRGDTMMRRHGAVLRLDELPGPIDALAYGFYTDIGAGVSAPEIGLFSSGVDISYNGLLGNFTDNDWVANAGIRASAADLGVVQPFVHLDMSAGIDRKELVAVDADTNGFAWGGGLNLVTGDTEDADGEALAETEASGLRAQASYFDSLGPLYNQDGLLASHGYVGMKAQQAGGMLFNSFLGFHPTAYVGMSGVVDTPHEPSRKAGTRVLQASAGYDLGKPWFRASWWYLQDTGLTRVNLQRLDQLDPPFGYARDEFRAEARLGKAIGQELNLDLGYQITEHVGIRGAAGIILPGEYYRIEIARVAGDALGSKNPEMPWGLSAGLSVGF